VSGVVGCTVLARRRHAWFAAAARGVAMAAAAGGVLVANDLVERLVLGTTVRASRAAGTAGGVGTSSSTRIQEAFTTTLGLNAASIGRDIVLGSLVVVLVAFGALRLRRDDGRVIGGAAIACAVLLYLVRFGAGLGFVPGVLTACPLAAVGVVAGWRRPLRLPTLIAVLALPLVWAFQYSGGAGPQWGGRYELLTGALLAVVGVVALGGCRRAFTAVLLVSVLVTGFGVAWLSVRSNTVADGISTVIARSDQMVISRHAHFFREGGALYDPTRHWLTATTDDDLVRAVRIAGETGASEFALVENEGDPVPAHLGAYERGATEVVPFLRPDVRVSVTTYRLRDAPTT
jgi:hypothetical protein